ncbi:MAG: Gfo/Idh/MocA family oxidoreductase [Verrucomicrobia bacterium]|nr:Gfo/Idh/MocA family oxidoreductase [Verrucomicrobiota bacterium]
MNKHISRSGSRLHRRDFLRSTAALAAAAFGAPYIMPSSVFGKNSPSNRITLAIIGCGNQSTVDIPEWLKNDDCQIVTCCDVNRGSRGYRDDKQFLGREPQRNFVNKAYAKKTGNDSYKGCDACIDFRDVLARKDVDAVAIITPDHWHAVQTIMAAEAGKDIYCQKPLSLTVRDGQEMIKAVRKHNRILQCGSQWRSKAHIRQACELVLNGKLGKLQRVESYVAENNFKGPGPGWKAEPVPEGFDYNFWLGPAPQAPYHNLRCFYKFRFILDYSGGQTTNFGHHSNGVVRWGVCDDLFPTEFEDAGSEWPEKGDLFTTPTKVSFRAKFPNGVELFCHTNKPGFGVRFEGSEGSLEIGSSKFECKPASLKDAVLGGNDKRFAISENHYRNFLDAVKARKDGVEPAEVAHRTSMLCHLGNIAMLLKRKFKFDPQTEQIVGDDEANKMLSRPLRAPWHY